MKTLSCLGSWALVAALALGAACVTAQSLYLEERWQPLIADRKALRPGDVLTVQVLENSSAVTSADTGTRRSNQLQGQLAHGASIAGQASLRVGGEFDGGGRTQRASRLLATVSVTVQEVLANGQLRIAGEQSVLVNDELQKVSLSGLVRPADISDANLVQSTRIADARITYVGEGELAERGRRAWWRRLADALGL